MVRELRELIEDIATIDTSVDMDDIKMISALNTDIVSRILSVRDFLIELNLPKTEKKKELPEVIPETIHEAIKDPVTEEITEVENDPYAELKKLGLTQNTIDICRELYKSRTKSAKMSFETVMKCALFVHNYVIVHGAFFNDTYTIGRLIVNRELEAFLKEADPNTRYVPANLYDFLASKNFKNITMKFFECKGTVLIATGSYIDAESPF